MENLGPSNRLGYYSSLGLGISPTIQASYSVSMVRFLRLFAPQMDGVYHEKVYDSCVWEESPDPSSRLDSYSFLEHGVSRLSQGLTSSILSTATVLQSYHLQMGEVYHQEAFSFPLRKKPGLDLTDNSCVELGAPQLSLDLILEPFHPLEAVATYAILL
jgi:hypothetical protein